MEVQPEQRDHGRGLGEACPSKAAHAWRTPGTGWPYGKAQRPR